MPHAASRAPAPALHGVVGGWLLLLAPAALLAGCGRGPAPAPPPPPPATRFVDVGAAAGVTAVSWCGRADKPHVLESGGNGLALLDVEGDGDLDLVVVGGWRLEGARVLERGHVTLYANRGDGTFADATAGSGLRGEAWFTGVAVGDPDGDGDPDLYLTAFGEPALWLNRGDGTFAPGVEPPGGSGWTTGAAFFDADGDGDEDLYVAGYVECTLEEVLHARPTQPWEGFEVMFGPRGLPARANRYYRNEGRGRFVEATAEAGLEDPGPSYSFGVLAADLDRDLDPDLYVANDSNPNFLFRNDGGGRFREVGLEAGAALSGTGAVQAGMGVAAGDVDGDGRVDLVVTNFENDTCTLYRALAPLRYADASAPAGLVALTTPFLSWGVLLGDYDLDGDLDLFIANGHLFPQADAVPGRALGFAQRNLLLENDRGRFRDVSALAGPGFEALRSSRGAAQGDLDGDGDLDLVISNVDAAPTVLRNDLPARGGWLLVEAPGAWRVEVEAGGRLLVRDAVRGGSYLSASDPRLHFGLGPDVASVRVRAVGAGGRSVEADGVAPGRLLRLVLPASAPR